ncbi:MAG: DUF362 domain-containing protein [Candidatus Undinarchaeales archaeon]|jgi:uncharacterized protein (DUF362 family)|nr:DUF362 domain-containing protein [Candidatus Undinarchaeales archaeon]MDP7493642.1 DUF362 domain-containing protein [Candidatus Undinarchaeales archaeon]
MGETGSGKSTVALLKCEEYDEENVLSTVRRSVDLLGGMKTFVGNGQRVLLKVNLLRGDLPERAITTHPAVVRAVTLLVQEAGGEVVIGDSPAGPNSVMLLRRAYKQSGYERVAKETGASLNEDLSYGLVPCRGGHLIKELDILNAVESADVVIPLPKLKTHVLTGFTGATKILFGVVPGVTKGAYHLKLKDVDQFSHMLLDIVAHVQAPLYIMDGVVAMHGDGPGAGDPFPVGAILAAADPVAMDRTAVALVGLVPDRVSTLTVAADRGMGPASLDDIDVLGDGLDAFSITGFRPASATSKLGSRLPGIVRRFVLRQTVASPYAGPKCIGCGVCAAACPVKAITITDKRAHMDLSTCIRCYCCHETCPEQAVELDRPLLSRVLGW